MPVNFDVLVTEVGGSDSNSYGTLDELKSYFQNRIEASDFMSLDDSILIARLIQAALIIDSVIVPNGCLVSNTQSLLFPRKNLYDKHGRKYSEDSIPNKIKYAQFEQALYCNTNNIMLPSVLTQGFVEAKLDVLSIKLDKDFVPKKISYDALDYLTLFGDVELGGDMHTVNVVRY